MADFQYISEGKKNLFFFFYSDDSYLSLEAYTLWLFWFIVFTFIGTDIPFHIFSTYVYNIVQNNKR